MGEPDFCHARRLPEKIVAALRPDEKGYRIVASSDFSHYVPADKAKEGDLYAIDAAYNA